MHLWSSMQGISVSTGMYTVTDCFWIVACGCFKISLSSCERRCSCLANGVKDTPVGKDNLLFARGEITSDNLTSSIIQKKYIFCHIVSNLISKCLPMPKRATLVRCLLSGVVNSDSLASRARRGLSAIRTLISLVLDLLCLV